MCEGTIKSILLSPRLRRKERIPAPDQQQRQRRLPHHTSKRLAAPSAHTVHHWEPYGEEFEIAAEHLSLDTLAKDPHLVVKTRKTTGELRCFGTTIQGLTNREVVDRYRLRWPVENGLKNFNYTYFIAHILAEDPEKIEANFYGIQVARLAHERSIQSLDERFGGAQEDARDLSHVALREAQLPDPFAARCLGAHVPQHEPG